MVCWCIDKLPTENVTSSTETNKPAGIKDAISVNNEAGATPVENEATPAKNEVAQAETEGTPAQNETTSPTDGTPTTLDNASSDTGAAAAGPSANKNTRKTIWPRAWRNAGETVPEFGRYPVNCMSPEHFRTSGALLRHPSLTSMTLGGLARRDLFVLFVEN